MEDKLKNDKCEDLSRTDHLNETSVNQQNNSGEFIWIVSYRPYDRKLSVILKSFKSRVDALVYAKEQFAEYNSMKGNPDYSKEESEDCVIFKTLQKSCERPYS